MAPPIITLVNMSFQQCLFLNCLKNALLSPVFKKDDSMNKTNFRPVSILVCFSKIFEKLYCWISSTKLCLNFYLLSEKFIAVKQSWLKWLKTGENVYRDTRLLLQCLSIWAKRLTACHTDFCWLNLAHMVDPMIVSICSCPIYQNVNNV